MEGLSVEFIPWICIEDPWYNSKWHRTAANPSQNSRMCRLPRHGLMPVLGWFLVVVVAVVVPGVGGLVVSVKVSGGRKEESDVGRRAPHSSSCLPSTWFASKKTELLLPPAAALLSSGRWGGEEMRMQIAGAEQASPLQCYIALDSSVLSA